MTTITIQATESISNLPNGRRIDAGDWLLIDPERQPAPGNLYLTSGGDFRVMLDGEDVGTARGVVVGRQVQFA